MSQHGIPKKIANFLQKTSTKHELAGHRTVYTAFDKAATLKIKPSAIAKVLVVKIDNDLAIAVVSGNRNLDMDKLMKFAQVKKIDFAKEKIIGAAFKGIDPGAIPPFPGLWQIKVFCDKKLLESPKIILSAGSYETSIKLSPSAFKKASPDMFIGNFSEPRPRQGSGGQSMDKNSKTKPKKRPVKPGLKKRRK